jgi:hypothetical protein
MNFAATLMNDESKTYLGANLLWFMKVIRAQEPIYYRA